MPATENTLAIVKPDFMNNRNSMLQILLLNGFRITHRKIINFTPEQAAEFYKDLEKQDPCFPIKVMAMSKGPAEAIILNKVSAIRDLLSLMASSNCCPHLNSGLEYKIHASTSYNGAMNEIRYIFPNFVFPPGRKVHFGEICGRKKLTGLFADGIFDAAACQTDDDREFLAKWLLAHSYEFESNAGCDQ